MTLSLLNLSRCSPTDHGQSLFISDLHLSEDTPHIEQGLTTFLEQEGDIDRLFYWATSSKRGLGTTMTAR